MKFFSFLSLIFFVSCGTYTINLDKKTFCAYQGYTDGGMTNTTGTASSVAYVPNVGIISSGGAISSSSIICVKPQNKYESCLAERLQPPASIIIPLNKEGKDKQITANLLYALILTIPIAWIYEDQVTQSVNKTTDIVNSQIRNAYEYCEKFLSPDSPNDQAKLAVNHTAQNENNNDENIIACASQDEEKELIDDLTNNNQKTPRKRNRSSKDEKCSISGDSAMKKGNLVEAQKLYSKACNSADMYGCEMLGTIENEKGNFIDARKWYNKACDGGSNNACIMLKKMTKKQH